MNLKINEGLSKIDKKIKNSKKNLTTTSSRKKEQNRKDGIKDAIQYFSYFLITLFSFLLVFYILGLISPCIRKKIDMITIEKIIYSVFSLFIGGIFGDHLKKYLKNEKEQKKN